MISREYDIDANVHGRDGGADEGVVINVYATERQDAVEVAREVQRVFIQWENQRKAAYA